MTRPQPRQAPATPQPRFSLRLARDAADRAAAERLRYAVFVEELGGDGPLVDHAARRERDAFDDHATQLLLLDETRAPEEAVVGLYRLMDDAAAVAAGRFYTEAEFDLAPLRASGRSLLELGRSCLHPQYRGGPAMMHLWQGLSAHVSDHGYEVLFGTASFHGTDLAALAEPLSLLQEAHLAPADLRVCARGGAVLPAPAGPVDRRRAMLAMPALIKAYLRLGGKVGEGVFVDRAFNTTDVCMILDAAQVTPQGRRFYEAPQPG
ncbi:GNAT family N-acetyltransferase [Pseudoroseicyclus aestuarii]|uniref:L-ornithine N(alpha)-acyltransferase n=1 Tax=Pseudoroseicyclus aestuarii TaxID=1795041 RepID=A0A318SX78_9RHOB|nr:GNAT family N-acyltransferase [Pseudoroseicyclus aestuarii]PYE86073.1 ornithine-acyl[acyl carrier protein] N-acyltransferase [Pseudoroseicyclus aestuarii]